jgi:hypothetical protein
VADGDGVIDKGLDGGQGRRSVAGAVQQVAHADCLSGADAAGVLWRLSLKGRPR